LPWKGTPLARDIYFTRYVIIGYRIIERALQTDPLHAVTRKIRALAVLIRRSFPSLSAEPKTKASYPANPRGNGNNERIRYSDNVKSSSRKAERRIARVSPYLGYQNIKEPSAVSDV